MENKKGFILNDLSNSFLSILSSNEKSLNMDKMVNKKMTKEQKLKQEVKRWKETCEIVGDKDIMRSIQISLNQIAQGKGIPLAQL